MKILVSLCYFETYENVSFGLLFLSLQTLIVQCFQIGSVMHKLDYSFLKKMALEI